MITLLIIVLVVIIIGILIFRLYLGHQAKKLSEDLTLSADIPTEVEQSYQGKVINESGKREILSPYEEDYQRALKLDAWLDRFHVNATDEIVNLISSYESIDSIVERHNKQVEEEILAKNKTFFDTCLKYPLDQQQRKAIIADEDNVLVVSSAGSGKTSSIVGKVKYLTEVKHVNPEKILLISYTQKAATELTERAGAKGLRGYTFHKLALDLIGKTTGEKPSICDNTDVLFVKIYHQLLSDKKFRKSILGYFVDYDQDLEDWEKRKRQRQQNLAEVKAKTIKAIFPDMDGNTFNVRSEQEKKIAYALTALGVRYRYEEPYEHQVSDEAHSQYCPDFSIHYEKNGKPYRLYLEHFGVDEHSLVPVWFAEEKGMSYDEANKRYNDGITWKKSVHEKFGTMMICTSNSDFHAKEIKKKLKTLLKDTGLPLHKKSDEELYNLVLPKGSNQEEAFIRLAVTFITLLKSRFEKMEDAINDAKDANDGRSVFVIKNIFQPVYKEYVRELEERKLIDFTDAILMATKLCMESHPSVSITLSLTSSRTYQSTGINSCKRCGLDPSLRNCSASAMTGNRYIASLEAI
jgi:DNA helicase-4